MFDFGFTQTRSWTGQVFTGKGKKYGIGPFRDSWFIKGLGMMRFNPETEKQRKRRMR